MSAEKIQLLAEVKKRLKKAAGSVANDTPALEVGSALYSIKAEANKMHRLASEGGLSTDVYRPMKTLALAGASSDTMLDVGWKIALAKDTCTSLLSTVEAEIKRLREDERSA